MLAGDHVDTRRQMRGPFLPCDTWNLKIRMKPDRHRHRLHAQVLNVSGHFQHAIGQPVLNFVFMGKRPLRHQVWIFPEFEAAGDARAIPVRIHLHRLPEGRVGEQAVNRSRAEHIAELHVKAVSGAVSPKGLFVQQVRPWRKERNPAQHRILHMTGKVARRVIENIFAMDLHVVHAVAERRQDGHFDARARSVK